MSYTPPSEDIEAEKEAFIEAGRNLAWKLAARSIQNQGDWSAEHRKECHEKMTQINEAVKMVQQL
jgi:hypothetical protein